MLFLLLTAMNIFFLNYITNFYSIPLGSKKYLFILLGSIILEILVFIFIIKSSKSTLPLEKKFLILFIPIGLLFLVAVPIGRAPDEAAHLTRSYGISVGEFITSNSRDGEYGEYIPADLAKLNATNHTYSNTIDILTSPGDTSEKTFVGDSTIAIYNFMNFIPQTTGFFIGRIMNLPVLITAYLARLFNFICFTILFYFAIKKAPFGKIFLFFIAFIPVVLQEATSLSADCLAIGISALLISFSLYLAYDKTAELNRKNYILLLIIMLFASLCKIVYLPLCFLIFLIPTSKFKSKRDRIIRTVMPIIAVIILNLIWLKFASRYLIEYNPGVSSGEQIGYILSSPANYLQTIFGTLLSNIYNYTYEIFGGSLEMLDLNMGHIYIILCIIVASILIYKNSESKIKIPPLDRAIIIGIIVIVIGLIFTSLYIQWTPVKNSIVAGIQGRYFLPVLLLAPAVACGLRKSSGSSTKLENHNFIYLFSTFYSIAALIAIISSHI